MIAMPTPAELFGGRPAAPRPVMSPVPMAPAEPLQPEPLPQVPRLPAGTPWLTRYQVALQYSSLHHNARHIGLMYALAADWTTGVMAPGATPGITRLSRMTGIAPFYVRLSRMFLLTGGWIVRHDPAHHFQVRPVELLIPPHLDPLR